MAKTYRAEYTLAKNNAFRIVGAGNYLVARIRAAAPEGKLVRFAVRQSGGTAVPFTVDWLDSLNSPGLVPGEFNPGTNPLPVASYLDLFRIRAQSNGIAGGSAANLNLQAGDSYAMQDGGFSNRPREIYMLLVPTGSAANTLWEVTVLTQDTVG
jgi:hypothetical protein